MMEDDEKNQIYSSGYIVSVFYLGFRFPVLAEETKIVEPLLEILSVHSPHRVALTLDLCMGRTDYRILDILTDQKIPATLFVTGRWIRTNGDAVRKIRAHPELFEIGNHGANHIPPVDNRRTVYGLKTAGSLKRICEEVTGGMQAIEQAGLAFMAPQPRWYRGATALYSPDAIRMIEKLEFRIAGFSLNGDQGASLLAPGVAGRIRAAKDGDVIIAHMNQPSRVSGSGVVEGILALKKKGYHFVKLSDAVAPAKSSRPASYKSCAEFLKGGPDQ